MSPAEINALVQQRRDSDAAIAALAAAIMVIAKEKLAVESDPSRVAAMNLAIIDAVLLVEPPKKPAKPKKPKTPSRPQRWADGVARVNDALGEVRAGLEELQSVQEEYREWHDNLPENLQGSALGEKLEAVTEIGVDDALSSVDEIDSAVGEAESADLPRGFGKD